MSDAISQSTGDDIDEAREKHDGIARSVGELERLGVDVPMALTSLLVLGHIETDDFRLSSRAERRRSEVEGSRPL